MTNREKVFLGLTAAAAIGAAVYYALPALGAKADATAGPRTDFTALITQVQVSLTQGELTEREEHALTAATTPWLRDPLRSRPLASTGTNLGLPLPSYTGFINTGPRPIAIIDGRDHRPGDSIRGGEFQVAGIYADRIELLRRGATDPVQVPLQQTPTSGESR